MKEEWILKQMIKMINKQNFTKQELQHKLDIARKMYYSGHKKYELTIKALEEVLSKC